MKKVVILGATGMLGSAIYGVLKDNYQLVLAVRDPKKIALLEAAYGKTSQHDVVVFDAEKIYEEFLNKEGDSHAYLKYFAHVSGDFDYVINAIGLTIAPSFENQALAFFMNGALPHMLADFFGEKLIHITTDCVYGGKEGFPYDEHSPKSPADVYGLSKSMGEPTKCLILRTSIIGRELEGFTGLLEWFLHQENKTITGFAGHFWNGVTTKQFGKVCDIIMQHPDQFPRSGLYHIFGTSVSKYDMLVQFQKKYGTKCEIIKDETKKLNRTLATVYDVQKKLAIPSFEEMVREL